MPCEAGWCTLCGAKTHIVCGTCGVKKLNDQFTEVEVEWTNGSKMKVGVCVSCAATNSHATAHGKQIITKAHHDHWDKHNIKHDKGIIVA